MSDPLSIAASVTGVAGAGFAVAKGLYQIANAIGSTGEEVRMYGDEIAAFAKLLCHVRAELLGPITSSQETQSLLSDTVHLCERILHPIQSMLSTLKPLLARSQKSEGKLREFGLRLQWIFRTKDKLLFYRNALNAQHKLLQTIMNAMILQTSRQRPEEDSHVFCVALNHSTAAATRSIYGDKSLNLQKPENVQNRLVQDPAVASSNAESIESWTADGANPQNTRPMEDGPGSLLMLVQSNASNSPNLTLLSTSSTPDTDMDEADILLGQIDHDLDPDHQRTIMAILTDMSIVSPRILEYAAQEMKLAQDGSDTFEKEASAITRTPLQNCRPERYRRVHAVLLHWQCDDLFVLPELEDLEQCLSEDYGYTTEMFSIPTEQPQMGLTMKVLTTLQSFQSSDSLFIIYYGGHAKIDDSRQSTWCANRSRDSPQLQWSSIQALFAEALPDVLIFLDCSSAAASAQFPRGDSVVETLAASSWEAISPDPGRYSFTNCLIEVLQEWKLRHFSAAMLHAEILARLKHNRPIMLNGKQFEARATPVYFAMTSNFRTPSIEISRQAAPPSPPEAGGNSRSGPIEAPPYVTIRSRSGYTGE